MPPKAGKPRDPACKLKRANAAGAKPRTNVPSPDALHAALTPPLVQRLCELYHQDYVCFGFSWPAASRAPPTLRLV